MFTNSGMMPFVPFFLGEEPVPFEPPRRRRAEVRAGRRQAQRPRRHRPTARRLSFFEMLGNWSFGDYFKGEAIRWAWDLLTEDARPRRRPPVGHRPRQRRRRRPALDRGGRVPRRADPASRQGQLLGDGRHRSVRAVLGDLLGLGPDLGPRRRPADPAAANRYVEIWNLVFMQYFRRPDGCLDPLPVSNVDTGAGLERMLTAVNGVDACGRPTCSAALVDPRAASSAAAWRPTTRADVAPARSSPTTPARPRSSWTTASCPPTRTAATCCGASSGGRSATAHLLGRRSLVMPGSGRDCVDLMADGYPELRRRSSDTHHQRRSSREEAAFRRTLKHGGAVLLDDRLAECPPARRSPGDVAFDLYATFGFPLEVTEEVARGGRASPSTARATPPPWRSARRISKAGRQAGRRLRQPHQLPAGRSSAFGTTDFVGREELEDVEATVQRGRRRGDKLSIFLDRAVLRRVRRSGGRHRRDQRRPRAGRGGRRHLRAAGLTAPRPASSRASVEPGQTPPPRSTSTGATPSGATTPAPTSSTGHCGRSSAIA